MQFSDVIGQDVLKAQLIREFKSGKVPHAQLFLSRPGTGGLPLALAFAQYLNCEQPGDTDSCGTCPACAKSRQLIHPDIHFTFPVITKKSGKPPLSNDYIKEWRDAIKANVYMSEFDWLQFLNAGNKQGNITALECRHVIKQLQLKAYEGRYKVQIIWKVEALGLEGNILLKLLEEPPPDTILILIVEEQERIINTILSRAQLKVFEDLPAEAIQSRLLAEQALETEKAAQIAYLADGNYHRALELADRSGGDLFKWLNIWLTASMNNNANELMEFITLLHGEGREKVKHFFDYLLHFFRECLTWQFQDKSQVRLMMKEKALAEKIWRFATIERIAEVVSLIEEKYYHVERNVNAKYILLDLSIQSRNILRGKAVA